MTRKRFVKLLMSRGISRDRAVAAVSYRPAGKSYSEYYPQALFSCMCGMVTVSTARASAAVRVLTAALVESSGSMLSMCEAFREAEERRVAEDRLNIYGASYKAPNGPVPAFFV